MMSDGPKRPTCIVCPHDFTYMDPIPMRKMGVMMHMGERFCVGGKKARRFKRSDPKIYAPAWCPKRKDPCELRVYTYKSQDARMLHSMLCASLGRELSPEEHHYALAHQLRTELSPRDFWERCDLESSTELLSVEVGPGDIVEIDDGLKPIFFYKTEMGYQMLSHFDADRARKNKKED